jgi:hypothetical protein
MRLLNALFLLIFVCGCFGNYTRNDIGWHNVKDYGAIGDGVNNDSVSIARALMAIPRTGGVLYFPPGSYKTSGGFTISYPITVLGCGMGNYDSTAVSQINCTSSTESLFTVKANSARFQNISLMNTSKDKPTSGAGITTAGTYLEQKVDYQDVSVSGYWIGIDVQTGAQWTANNVFIINPVKYGMRINNLVNNDAGDWSITNLNINSVDRNADAALRIESSGGGKISNMKINCGYPINGHFNHGVDLTSSAQTIILHISNTSIENFTGDGIHINLTGNSWRHFYFIGVGIGVPIDASGCAISITSYALNQLENVVIGGCVFYGKKGSAAITLNNVNNVSVFGCINSSFDNLIKQSGCSNVTGQTK